MPFPNHKQVSSQDALPVQDQLKEEPKMLGEGLAVVLMGFTSTALFVVWQTWLPQLGLKLIGLGTEQATQLLSYFSIGALVSVLLLSIVLDKFISPIMVAIIYPIGAFLAMLALFQVETYSIVIVSTFFLGLFTAGIFQLAMSIMMKLFPTNKATASSYVNIAASSAFILVPLITSGLVSTYDIKMTLFFDMIIAVISILLAVFVLGRMKKLFR